MDVKKLTILTSEQRGLERKAEHAQWWLKIERSRPFSKPRPWPDTTPGARVAFFLSDVHFSKGGKGSETPKSSS